MAQKTRLAPHIVSIPGVRRGQPIVDEKGIMVKFIAIWHEREGLSVAEICDNYDLTPAEVHAALAYYFDHQDEFDAEIRADDSFFEEARNQPSPLIERLRAAGAIR